MNILNLTRNEIICDLSKTFREHNNLTAMDNEDLKTVWKEQGIHAGTWDWDNIEIIKEGIK